MGEGWWGVVGKRGFWDDDDVCARVVYALGVYSTDAMLSQRKVWRLFFEGNVLFRSALKRMGAADWKVYQVGQASCNDL